MEARVAALEKSLQSMADKMTKTNSSITEVKAILQRLLKEELVSPPSPTQNTTPKLIDLKEKLETWINYTASTTVTQSFQATPPSDYPFLPLSPAIMVELPNFVDSDMVRQPTCVDKSVEIHIPSVVLETPLEASMLPLISVKLELVAHHIHHPQTVTSFMMLAEDVDVVLLRTLLFSINCTGLYLSIHIKQFGYFYSGPDLCLQYPSPSRDGSWCETLSPKVAPSPPLAADPLPHSRLRQSPSLLLVHALCKMLATAFRGGARDIPLSLPQCRLLNLGFGFSKNGESYSLSVVFRCLLREASRMMSYIVAYHGTESGHIYLEGRLRGAKAAALTLSLFTVFPEDYDTILIPTPNLAVIKSMHSALENVMSAVFEEPYDFGRTTVAVHPSLCIIFTGLVQQPFSLKGIEPAFVEVLWSYLDALDPFLKHYTDAIGNAFKKIAWMSISFHFNGPIPALRTRLF